MARQKIAKKAAKTKITEVTKFHLLYSQGMGGEYTVPIKGTDTQKAIVTAQKEWKLILEGGDPDDQLAGSPHSPVFRRTTYFRGIKFEK